MFIECTCMVHSEYLLMMLYKKTLIMNIKIPCAHVYWLFCNNNELLSPKANSSIEIDV